MAEINERIGGRIRELRTEAGWTQEKLARQLSGNRTGSEVSRWERGEVKPRDETVEEIADVFRTDVASFYAVPRDEKAEAASPLDALSGPASTAELAERLEWIESALVALLAERGLELDAQQSEQEHPPHSGSSTEGSRNG